MTTLFPLSFRKVNKLLLLITIASLAYKRGHFAGTFIPSPFQALFVLSLILTVVYIVREYSFRDIRNFLSRKIVLAFAGLFLAVVLGWVIGSVFVHIPTTFATMRDFGTFTISILTFLLVLFYTKNDLKYATWCLYALLIPNISPFYYFFTHGFVGYWGVANDGSLTGVVDPNLFSKTILVPALFFITAALFALKDRKGWAVAAHGLVASLYAMLIFWTASRGSALSLVAGAGLIWVLFSAYGFTWRKLVGGAAIIVAVLSIGLVMVPHGVKHELYTKVSSTGTLPRSADGKVISVVETPEITNADLGEAPRTDVRLFEWNYFIRYGARHPLGVGPSSSSIDYQNGDLLQLRPGNTYIQVWLWGGIIAFGCLLYILRNAFNTLWMSWKRNYSERSVALIGILFALSIAIIFDASLYFYWYFIVLALAFQGASLKTLHKPASPHES